MPDSKHSTRSTTVFAIDVFGVTFSDHAEIKACIQQVRAALLEDIGTLQRFTPGQSNGYYMLREKLTRQRAALLYAAEHLAGDEGLPRLA